VAETDLKPDALAAALRERILGGDIAPGERLPEVELCATYDVARPTVRAALQELVHEGLLQREPHHSAKVPRLSREDIADLFFIRAPLEIEAVRVLVERGAKLPEAEAALKRLRKIGPDAPPSDTVDGDLAFHSALVDALQSPRYSRVYRSLGGEIRLCIAQLRATWADKEWLVAEHRELLEAIYGGSVTEAVNKMRSHLERAVHELEERVSSRG
jgi:DNA-binding GntR family transcriptional regulator